MDGLTDNLWTSGISLRPRGGMVAPEQNNKLKGPLFFIRSLDRVQIFIGVFKGSLPYCIYCIITLIVDSLDIKNLAETLLILAILRSFLSILESIDQFYWQLWPGGLVKLKLWYLLNMVSQKHDKNFFLEDIISSIFYVYCTCSITWQSGAGIGGGMAKVGVGFSPGQDFINIFWLVLCKKNS